MTVVPGDGPSMPNESAATLSGGVALDDRTTVDVAAAFRTAGLTDIIEELDRELVGLAPVKARIREIASLLLIARLRERTGRATEQPTLHMSFTGRPGTGKTTVARRMATILHRLGYVRKGHLVTAGRDDLVGQYVGHTAPKTREVLKRAMGGVLFIDEAYYLYRADSERDYGAEAIETMLAVMENQRDDLVVIFAGYGDQMDTFFQANPGLRSRVAHHIEFPDFTADELMAIAELMVREQQYELDDEARATLREYLMLRMHQAYFSNARSVRNAIDRAKLRQASRLVGQTAPVPARELSRIDAADIRASRVFRDAPPADGAE